MNKRIKKKHYDLKCDKLALDELCWDYLQSINVSRCSNSLKKERKCPYYFPYKKPKKFWRKLNKFIAKNYIKRCLRWEINKNT